MVNSNAAAAILRSEARRLSKILHLDETTPDDWSQADQAAMLRHQMSAPLDFDLGGRKLTGSRVRERYQVLHEAAALGVRTFQDLFRHPGPPLAVLRITKDFFKVRAGPADERRPEQEVAYLMYLLTISAARVRTGQTITSLSGSELLRGVEVNINRNLFMPSPIFPALLPEGKLRPVEGRRPQFRAQTHRQAFWGPKGQFGAPLGLFQATNSSAGSGDEAAR